jgi:V8-like Glu-specific endopeptidase
MSGNILSLQRLVAVGTFALTLASGHLNAQDNFSSQASPSGLVTSSRGVTALNVNNQTAGVDFVHAKPLPLPVNPMTEDSTQALLQALVAAPAQGTSAYSPGAAGSGKTSPVFLGVPEDLSATSEAAPNAELTPQDFGTNNHPFTTARADLFTENTNTTYPYRAAGKLFFNEPGGSFICSASLIRRGIVVTAAHCVANFGKKQFYSGWQFVPGYRNGSAPFGVWTVKQVLVLTSYYNGTDSCATSGIVCADDVAVLILNTQNGGYAGTTVGWFGYWYGGGFTSNGLAQITQLGYPAGLNSAAYMERGDSQGYTSSSNSRNTIIGSNMNGGSSGGPWIVNFGLPYVLTGETNGSGYSFTNAVVGVTSWGYTSNSPKEQGASPFTSGNIQMLLNSACSATSAACS